MNTPTTCPTLYSRAQVVQQALEMLECEARESDALASPDAVRDYLRILLADRPHEVFAVVFLDAQNRVIVTQDGQYDFQGRMYPSLSMIAREITGTRWSGPLFFGLKAPATPKTAAKKGARR